MANPTYLRNYKLSVRLTSAQLLALNTTRVVASPRFNRSMIFQPQYVIGSKAAGTAYTVSGSGVLQLFVGSTSAYALLPSTGFLDQATAQRAYRYMPASVDVTGETAFAARLGSTLEIGVSSGGSFTLGTGTVSLLIFGDLIPLVGL